MSESRTAVLAALAGNGMLAILKGAGALVTGSAAMLAETCHSIADTGNQCLLFLGMRLAERPPDDEHPFGYGKDVYFWGFVVSMMLFSLGGAVSVWEAVRHYLHPVVKEISLWAYGGLAAGFVFETASLAIALRELRRAKGDRSLRAYWRESRDATLITVLLEDSAALVSLTIAVVAIWLTARTGNGTWDAAGSALIGLLLLAVAVVLAFENYSLLLGERASPGVEQAIRRAVTADPAVEGIAALHTMHLGPTRILIVIEARFAPDLRATDVERAVERVQRRIIELLGHRTDSRLIVVEPSSSRTARHESLSAQRGGVRS